MEFNESWQIASPQWGTDARRVIFRSDTKWPPSDKSMLTLDSVQCTCVCNGFSQIFWLNFADTLWSTEEFFLSDPKWPPSGVLYDSSLCVSTKHVHNAFPGIMWQNLIKNTCIHSYYWSMIVGRHIY